MKHDLVDENEDRWVELRTQYLVRAIGLREIEARTLALRELGYSSSGIAAQVDVEEPTVKKHLEQLANRFGAEAIETRTDTFDVDTHPEVEL